MIDRLLDASVRFRWAVLLITVVVALYGAFQLLRVPIDAVPDVTNKQVQINTSAPAFGPLDIERLVTYPVETAMAGIPGLSGTRSLSRNGFSQVTAVFEDGTDIYFARQQVAERISQAKDALPAGIEPQMGPITTGLGDVLMWMVDFKPAGTRDNPRIAGRPGPQPDGSYLTPEGELLRSDVEKLAYLRTVQDWLIRPQLRSVAGTAGVDALGGYVKQFVVQPDPSRLAAYGISFAELAEALEAANISAGANFIERGGEAFLVKADGRVRSADEIRRATVATRGGRPVTVRDVGTVAVGGELRSGSAAHAGREAVVGTVLMRAGANSRIVARDASAKLAEIATSLPPGIAVHEVYNRSKLVNSTIATVEENLLFGALLVIAVLFWLLGNIRAAIIAALVIPLSFLLMAIGMNRYGVSGNLMSLGALDFGLIVDGSIIIIENCLRRLAERQHQLGRVLALPERLHEVFEASKEMVRPTIFGQAIIFLVFAPLLTFSGIEGKMFTPMAIAVMLALLGAFILSLTFVPAMVAILIRGRVAEKEVRAIGWTKERYEPVLRRIVARPWPWVGAGVGTFALAALVFMALGREFIPTLDEGDLVVEMRGIPSMSLDQTTRQHLIAQKLLAGMPEIAAAYSKIGTADLGNDPMPPNAGDFFIILKPKDEWPAGVETKEAVIARIEKRLARLTGVTANLSQPIEMRFNELIGGVRNDVAIKLFGDDLGAMAVHAQRVRAILETIPGAADVNIEQTEGFPTLDVQFDRNAIARYGLSMKDVADTVAAAMGGREAGLVFEGDRRFDIVVRLDNATRHDLDAVGSLPVMLPSDGSGARTSVPLRELAKFSFAEGLNQVSRENGRRRVVVQSNVRGSDLGSFVEEAKEKVATQIHLPPGSNIEWGGQYENLQAASARLSVVVPVVLIAILVILFMALGSWPAAAAVYSAVPLGLAGGVFGLAIARLPFSVSAAVGFIVLSGVTVLNGLIVMSSIRDRIAQAMPVEEAVVEGTMERVRAVLMTGIVPAIGFVPMALATGQGAEVQRPLAVVVISGLITATLLTLFVLPAISKLLLRQPRKQHVAGEYAEEDAFGREAKAS